MAATSIVLAAESEFAMAMRANRLSCRFVAVLIRVAIRSAPGHHFKSAYSGHIGSTLVATALSIGSGLSGTPIRNNTPTGAMFGLVALLGHLRL